MMMESTIKINEIYPSPESGTEWIEFFIKDEASDDLDLANYTIFDSYHQIHKFNDEKFDNQFLVIEVSGLNNDQDSVILKDPSGNILDSFTYNATQKGQSWSRENNTNNFVISEASRGQINPTPTPTSTPTPTTSTAPSITNSPTINPTATPTTIQQNHASVIASNSNNQTRNNFSKSHPYDLSQIKLNTEEEISANKDTRLVILGKNPAQTELMNVIIGSLIIVLSASYLIYVKRKSKQD